MDISSWFLRDLNVVNGVYIDSAFRQQKELETANQFHYEFDSIPNRVDYDKDLKQKEDTTLFFLKTGIDEYFFEKNKTKINIKKLQSIDEFDYKGDFSFLNNKIVVDAGCGNGRFAAIVAPHCKLLICLDIGNHIFETKKRLANFSNIVFIQCSLLHIPLKPEIADFIYSIGVIHHTPSPHESLRQLTKILKPKGYISIWVYPENYWGNWHKSFISKAIRQCLFLLPFKPQLWVIRKILMPIGRFQLKLEKRGLKFWLAPFFLINVPRHEDYNEMLSTTIDFYLPPFIFTHSLNDLKLLFESCRLTFKPLKFPTSAIGQKN